MGSEKVESPVAAPGCVRWTWSGMAHGMPLIAREIGRAAFEALREPALWHVIACHSHSAYIRSDRGAVVCVGGPSIGRGAMNVPCDGGDSGIWSGLVTVGETVVSSGDGWLLIGGRVSVDFGKAGVWEPATFRPVSRGILIGRLAALTALVSTDAPDGGYGPLIPRLIGASEEGGPCRGSTSGALMAEALFRGARDFRDWLRGRLEGDSRSEPGDAVRDLIGLGVGLTPSGDDFLGGALLALRALRHDVVADRLSDWLLPLLPARTGAVSAAHLACAAAGRGGEAVHAALEALSAMDGGGAEAAIGILAGYGHSSGWDILAGMVIVLHEFAMIRE